MKTILTIRGNTKPIKDVLRRAGWRWQPTINAWTREVTPAQAEAIVAGDHELLRALGGRKKGCQTLLSTGTDGGRIIYTSPTYVDGSLGVSREPVPGTDYCDAAGNYIGGKRIPGSAPDDLV